LSVANKRHLLNIRCYTTRNTCQLLQSYVWPPDKRPEWESFQNGGRHFNWQKESSSIAR